MVILTEWEQFRALDFTRLKQVMRRPVLIDLRNIYRADEVARHGFIYSGVGRPRH
jgi:UDPglucose 6-dehydrogenase